MSNPSDKPKTVEALQEQLAAYQRALEEEFTLKNNDEGESTNLDKISESARAMLIRRVPSAVGTIEFLESHAVSETVRLQAAKFIIENALGKGSMGKPVDPIANLLDKLKANDPAKAE